jgi:hypothetical protein
MTSVAVAIEKRQWQLLSLYLLLGVSEAASRLPPESLSELVDLLAGEQPRRQRHGR